MKAFSFGPCCLATLIAGAFRKVCVHHSLPAGGASKIGYPAIHMLDLTDPANPIAVATRRSPAAQSVKSAGNHLYLVWVSSSVRHGPNARTWFGQASTRTGSDICDGCDSNKLFRQMELVLFQSSFVASRRGTIRLSPVIALLCKR